MANRLEELREFVRDFDSDVHRPFPFEVEQVRDSGAGGGVYTVRGLASVYNRWSLDLGGFRERVTPGAFDDVLSRNPHVLHVWDHDTRFAFSSTDSKEFPLELKSVKEGLGFFSRVAPTSYAKDLRILLEGGVIRQSSFSFTVDENGGQEWRVVEENGEKIVERDVTKVTGLFDVTTCAMGAYPQTTSALALRSLARRNKFQVAIPADLSRRSPSEADPDPVPEPVADAPAVVVPEAEPAAPLEVGDPPAPTSDDADARKREHDEWATRRDKLIGEWRRTRKLAFGVNDDRGDK